MRNISDLHDMKNERSLPEITSDYDIKKDAWNRRAAKNNFSNEKKYDNMEPHEQEILDLVKWMSLEESEKILIPYLTQRYKRKKCETDEKVSKMAFFLNKQKISIFENMEKLTKHPIYLKNFKIRWTTCKRWPYNWKTWEIWVYIFLMPEYYESGYSHAFVHELLHMQTHKYYENEYPMNHLNKQQFILIKESLTFLLNYEFPWVNMVPDEWYLQHKEYRKVLEDYRLSCWDKKDFEDLINFGCDYILWNNILAEY